ncbi:MAG: LytTR family DNA-binding domain-containing protein [Bacteroidota bacterium]|jgi:DNA-binding LytR/AlgR family response regulator|nr:LytTR family DNA-binding domain-containing protein [Bacteroidota bacterium]MDP4215128.1 LytTR family DNA-binding domain-containing protein [Bacteroidota bacterium]MDP4254322.1 LytTR family DNA-binding domain-containing protein [Bacteroidota bacterium]MDP4258800.1 LytTR family DNA-binding domain-containing protein [Bacteroidota bacterium]
MKVLIVEDEKPAYENLVEELQAIDESIAVMANCNSVDASVRWLNKNPQPDLILMDIQLSDGLSFNIFKACNITCPVIFTTAYDKYLTQAFEYSSIDYLLKPISQDKLRNAIKKYKALQSHFVNNHSALTDFINNHDKKKSRILVKRGTEFQTVRVEDTCYFFTEHKLVFLVDKENRKYMAEKSNLSDLEEELDRNVFYRANRKYIINANYVKRFKPLERSKISVELVLPVNEEIIISQENSASFKKWIGEI